MENLNIGIIVGTTREGRVSPQVASWFKELADQRNDANYEIIDIKEYQLPLLGETNETKNIVKWNQKLSELDGFVFVTAEYNHGIPASLKNALDLASDAWNNKSAGIVSYGSAMGARAAEQLRGVLGELQVADVRVQVLLSLFTDFENYTNFKPADLHKNNVNLMLDQVLAWANALKTLRD
jgi:NAD(P)H-dependent FMN reductase